MKKYLIGLVVGCLIGCFLWNLATDLQIKILKDNACIKNSFQRIPYDEFLKERNATPPITGIWIENGCIYVSTDKDGVVDIRPLEIEFN